MVCKTKYVLPARWLIQSDIPFSIQLLFYKSPLAQSFVLHTASIWFSPHIILGIMIFFYSTFVKNLLDTVTEQRIYNEYCCKYSNLRFMLFTIFILSSVSILEPLFIGDIIIYIEAKSILEHMMILARMNSDARNYT